MLVQEGRADAGLREPSVSDLLSRFRAWLQASQNLITQAGRSGEVWPKAGFPPAK